MNYSNEELDFWADSYLRLELEHGIGSEHHLSFEHFMRQPARNERWIAIYFANPALLGNRRHQAHITLAVFLAAGAPLVLVGAQVIDQQQREALGEAAEHLLARQQAAAHLFETFEAYQAQEDEDRRYEKTHTVEHRGHFLIEAFHRYAPCIKWKTRGAHVA